MAENMVSSKHKPNEDMEGIAESTEYYQRSLNDLILALEFVIPIFALIVIFILSIFR